jgi:putative transposase
MSRLRRIAQHSRFFFITCNPRRNIRPLGDVEFAMLADALCSVRDKIEVAICGYCIMPDHWHAIFLPAESTSISDVLLRVKTASSNRVRNARRNTAPIWQPRFFDHILRTRGEFDETLEYMHENPVKQALVENSLDWKWSSARWFADRTGPVPIADVRLPMNPGGFHSSTRPRAAQTAGRAPACASPRAARTTPASPISPAAGTPAPTPRCAR